MRAAYGRDGGLTGSDERDDTRRTRVRASFVPVVEKVSRETFSALTLIAATAFTPGQVRHVQLCSTMSRVGSHSGKRLRRRCEISRRARASLRLHERCLRVRTAGISLAAMPTSSSRYYAAILVVRR